MQSSSRSADDDNKSAQLSSKGNLLVPKDANILYVEPGIVTRVNVSKKQQLFQGLYLYEKAPEHIKNDYTVIDRMEEITFDNEDPKESEEKHIIVTVRAKDGTTETLIATPLHAQTVLARPFEYPDPNHPGDKIIHPFLMQVATFTRVTNNRANLPESGHDIRIKQIGYMYHSDLDFNKENFKKFDKGEVLFETAPQKTDIIQSWMPDCFFLSSINAILNSDETGSHFIQNMMKQQDDGTTIVRLYDPRTLKAVYVKVDNSYHFEGDQSKVAHRAPWVHILEKAYAGFAFKLLNKDENFQAQNDSKNVGLTYSSFLSVFGGGGPLQMAIEILTGQKANITFLVNNDDPTYILSDEIKTILTGAPYSLFVIKLREQGQNIDQLKEDLREGKIDYSSIDRKFITILNEHKDAEETGNWFNRILDTPLKSMPYEVLVQYIAYINIIGVFYRETSQKLHGFLNPPELTPEDGEYIPRSRGELVKILENIATLNPPVPKEAMEYFYEYAKTLPSAFLSGEYKKYDKDVFERLSQRFKAGYLLAATTLNEFPKSVPGLAQSHCYTITNVHEKTLTTGETLLMVRLRNPWGKTGRVYDYAKKDAHLDDNAAEFDLDISEFTEHFASYGYSSLLKSDAELNLQQDPSLEREVLTTEIMDQQHLNQSFDLVEPHARRELISNLINRKTIDQFNDYLKRQTARGLCDMVDYLQLTLRLTEEKVYNEPSNQHLVKDVAMINKMLHVVDSYVEQKAKTFHLSKDEYLAKNDLAQFSAHPIELNEPSVTERNAFVQQLLTKGISAQKQALALQGTSELYTLAQDLKEGIKNKKALLTDDDTHISQKIIKKHIAQEKELYKITKKVFCEKLEASPDFQQIKDSAKELLQEQNKGMFWKAKTSFLMFSPIVPKTTKYFKINEITTEAKNKLK